MKRSPFSILEPAGTTAVQVALAAALAVSVLAGCEKKVSRGWTTHRFDIARSGITEEDIGTTLSPAWVFRPAHPPKPAWYRTQEEMPRSRFDNAHYVAAAHGKVYFGSTVDNKVYALDADSGEIDWSFFTEGPVRTAPSVYGNRLYFGSDDGYVYCLNAGNGRLVWKYRAGPRSEKLLGNGTMISLWPVRSSVLVDDDTVYFTAGVFPYEGIYI
ncbi:MAG: PQQ-binding-like beta-propeller repeat protein, partial [Candidatus Latescibacteria bacterium]|nr:PQQ-binding-like beta-propeller repeat protein [Candidatus Latescibacterota bacterium]